MPSNRRLRVLVLLLVLGAIVTLYVTSAARQSQSNPFYTKTADALEAARAAKEAALGSRDHSTPNTGPGNVQARLKEAEAVAKQAADKKAEDFHGEQIVDTKRKEAEALKDKAKDEVKEGIAKLAETVKDAKDAVVDKVGPARDAAREVVMQESKEQKQDTPEEIEARRIKEELNSILKRSPIIIFSKSYCRFSKKAKHILLDEYTITPAPFVVELDQHELGAQLQSELGSSTGRRTVPNVLINGKSIGGGDDVEDLHTSGKLIDTIKTLGGKRMEVTKKT